MPIPAAEKNIEKCFLLYLLINPFLDIYSGAYIHIGSNIAREKLVDLITPTLILRMFVLLLFAAYIISIKDKKTILTIVPIGVAWVLSVIGARYLFQVPHSLFADMSYIAKYVYNIGALCVFWRIFQRSSWSREQILQWLNWLFSFTLLVMSVSIIVPFMLGLGYSTYSDRFGNFGTRGFFYSGNDVTAVLMLLLPICLITYFRHFHPQVAEGKSKFRLFWHKLKIYLFKPNDKNERRDLFYLWAPAAAITALFAIATKTAYVCIIATLLVMLGYCIYRKRKFKDGLPLKAFSWLMVAALILFILMCAFGLLQNMIENWGRQVSIIDEEGTSLIRILLSGRQDKLKAAYTEYRASGPYGWLFGISRGSQAVVIEMDLFEVVFYYGLFGAVTMLWLYLKLGCDLVARFVKRPDAYGLACFLAVGLCAGYLTLAGHVVFSVTSGFYFALVLLYSHLYFAESTDKLQILPGRRKAS